MENCSVLRAILPDSLVVQLANGAVVNAHLKARLSSAAYRGVEQNVSADRPRSAKVQLGGYSMQKHAFTESVVEFELDKDVVEKTTQYRRVTL